MSQIALKESQEVYVVKEKLRADTERQSRQKAIESEKTYAVAAAISCGLLIRPDGFDRVIDGFNTTQTTVTFTLDAPDSIVFRAFEEESIDADELMRRLGDENWVRSHPDHPIAFMYWALKNYHHLVKAIKGHAALMMFKGEKGRAFCVVGGDPDKNAYMLRKAGFGEGEIKEILASISPKPPISAPAADLSDASAKLQAAGFRPAQIDEILSILKS